ncbi:MAG: nitroreductase family protein [Bacillota bacterium]
MENIIETIKKRYSVRTYEVQPVESEKLKKLDDFLAANTQGPFGNKVRFNLVDIPEDAVNELKKLISYGNVKGARIFIAGSVVKGKNAMEDFGYCMEKNILMATSLNLGTVWLGGSLNRSTFASKIGASDEEVIPAITPLGYPADKRSMVDRLIRTLSGGKNRKEFGEVFYRENISTPLDKAACGNYSDVLETVRLAPSASNKQPWRIIKEKDKNNFHFYLNENRSYNAIFKDIKIQNIDMGIAMCHFELTARQLGLEGSWHVDKPDLASGDLIYIVSWKE